MSNNSFSILFICTGNICRSPIGEALLRKKLNDAGLGADVRVASAGTNAWDGLEPSGLSVQALSAYQTDLEGFQSHVITSQLLEKTDFIIACDYSHRDFMDTHFPEHADKLRLVGQFVAPGIPVEVPDPMGKDILFYEEVTELISTAIDAIIDDWGRIKQRFYQPKGLTVSLGADHRGFEQKDDLVAMLTEFGCQTIDRGTNSEQSCDHPTIAFNVANDICSGIADRGILVCSSGHGMIISANKVYSVRAVLPLNVDHANMSRTHNNSNVICFGADYTPLDEINRMVRSWLKTDYFGGKYHKRVQMITEYEINP